MRVISFHITLEDLIRLTSLKILTYQPALSKTFVRNFVEHSILLSNRNNNPFIDDKLLFYLTCDDENSLFIQKDCRDLFSRSFRFITNKTDYPVSPWQNSVMSNNKILTLPPNI